MILFLKCDVWASMRRTTSEDFDATSFHRQNQNHCYWSLWEKLRQEESLEATSWSLTWELWYFTSSGARGSLLWEYFSRSVTCCSFYGRLRNVNLRYTNKTVEPTLQHSAMQHRTEEFVSKCWDTSGEQDSTSHMLNYVKEQRLSTSSVFSMSTENTE